MNQKVINQWIIKKLKSNFINFNIEGKARPLWNPEIVYKTLNILVLSYFPKDKKIHSSIHTEKSLQVPSINCGYFWCRIMGDGLLVSTLYILVLRKVLK